LCEGSEVISSRVGEEEGSLEGSCEGSEVISSKVGEYEVVSSEISSEVVSSEISSKVVSSEVVGL
jgi:hypothetical protein